MSTTIVMKAFKDITGGHQDSDADYTITGRLLGVCTVDEGNQIILNDEISKRIHTKETKQIHEVVTHMYEIFKTTNLKNAGRLVVAIKSINNVKVQTRQLLITTAVSLMAEETLNIKDTQNKIGVLCDDDVYFTITENIE